MRQALHIFRKDVRYLRIEIGLMLVLAAAFAWVKIHIRINDWPDALVALAAAYLIARVIHADAIPGDRQFWLTRPYNRMSLAGAKLMFVWGCICVPIGLAQMGVALALGFPLRDAAPGLFWAQVFMFAAGAVPVVALAAVTSNIVPFICTALILALVVSGAQGARGYWFPGNDAAVPEPVEWIRDVVFAAAVLGVAILVLLWQYRDRSTAFSRVFAIVALNGLAALFLFVPASAPLRAQAWLSKKPALAAPVTISLKRPDGPAGMAGIGRGRFAMMRIPLMLTARSLPDGVEVRADALSISLEWPGRIWKPAMPGVNRRSQNVDGAVFDLTILMDPALYKQKREIPAAIRGSIFLTLFGEEERRAILPRNGRANAQDGLQCVASQFAGESDALVCMSLFRWPARLVYAQSGDEQSDFSNSRVSYSPFPADMSLDPLNVRWSDPIKTGDVTIVTRKPLTHFRRDFEIDGVRLEDFESSSRR
jgi:hypothetical protein